MAAFVVILVILIVSGLIVGGFMAAEARMHGYVSDMMIGACHGIGVALVTGVILLGVGSCTCAILPPGPEGYTYTEEYGLVKVEFVKNDCSIWFNDKNNAIDKITIDSSDTHVAREKDAVPSVTITRSYYENSGTVNVCAEITVPIDFTFEGEPDA